MLREFNEEWAIVDLLSDFILDNSDVDIFEIGFGITSQILNCYAVEHDRTHYICDINRGKISKARKNLKRTILYNGKSLDFIKEIDNISISIGMIDGEHRYETAIKEFNWIFKNLNKNGIIFIHDTYPYDEKWISYRKSGDVYKVRQELEKRDDLQIFTWPYGSSWKGYECGLSMVMKKEENRPFYKR